MKKKRSQQEERRRPLAEINLTESPKARITIARRGCLGSSLMVIAIGITAAAGLAALR